MGLLEKSFHVYNGMPTFPQMDLHGTYVAFRPNVVAWSSLLWACAAKNDAEAMKERFARFFERKNGR